MSNCRIPRPFEAVSLKELNTWIRRYPFYTLFFYQSVALRTSNRHTMWFIRCFNCMSKCIRGYAVTIIKRIFTKWIRRYADRSEKVDTQIRSDWVSAYPPIFRGCFKVAGYSAVKPRKEYFYRFVFLAAVSGVYKCFLRWISRENGSD